MGTSEYRIKISLFYNLSTATQNQRKLIEEFPK